MKMLTADQRPIVYQASNENYNDDIAEASKRSDVDADADIPVEMSGASDGRDDSGLTSSTVDHWTEDMEV